MSLKGVSPYASASYLRMCASRSREAQGLTHLGDCQFASVYLAILVAILSDVSSIPLRVFFGFSDFVGAGLPH